MTGGEVLNDAIQMHAFGNKKSMNFKKKKKLHVANEENSTTKKSYGLNNKIDGEHGKDNTISTRKNNTKIIVVKETKGHGSERQCRVIIEDKVDYHFEVIESVVKRYPLPIDDFDCDITQPINFQFSLYQNRVEENKVKKTAYWEWLQYYEKYLKGRDIERVDGSVAHFGEMISYAQYFDSKVDAIVGVTCDWGSTWYKFISIENNYCVLHGTIDNPDKIYEPKDGREKRLCWVNPMFADKCYFLPVDLPSRAILQNDPDLDVIYKRIDEIQICVIGSKDYEVLADVLFELTPEYLKSNKVSVQVLTRGQNSRRKYMRKTEGMLDDIVTFVLNEEFLMFQKRISLCNIILPMVDPETAPRYFPGDLQKLSGSMSQLVSYEIPAVMRAELFDIYKDHLIGIPVEVFKGSKSFASALKAMITTLASNRTLSGVNI